MNDIHLKKISPMFGAIRIEGTEKEPLFCASDVCKALGFSNPWKAVGDHVDDDDLTKCEVIDSQGRKQNTNFVTESGLYALIFGSKLPRAKEFKQWVTSEVLPSIRQDGGYMAMGDEESEEDLMARALVVAQATLRRREERIKQLEQKSKEDEPYTVFGRAMTIAKEGCLLGEFAKILTQNGIKIGQNNLFRWMRDNNYLCKTGEKWNLPLQRYTEQELFVVKPDYRKGKDGELIQVFTTKITGKGQMYFINKFLGNPDLLNGYYNGNKK